MANAFNNFFLRTTKELNMHTYTYIRQRRKILSHFFRNVFSVNCHNIQIISVTEAEITSIINFFKTDEVMMTW